MTVTVNWETATSVPAAAMRLAMVAAMTKSAPVTARDGVLRSGALAVTAPGGSMAVSIAAGQAMISGYQLTNDATATVTLDVGGATARTDLIVARVYDAEAGDAQTKGAIEVVKGISAAEPALPARSIKLASVTVAASASTIASGNLTDKRTYTTGAGGVLWLPGALTAAVPAGLDNGTVVWDPQAKQIGVNDGGTWRKYVDIDSMISPVITSGLTWTMDPAWTMAGYRICKRNGIVYLVLRVTLNAGQPTITITSAGSANVSICTVPTGYNPEADASQYFAGVTTVGRAPLIISVGPTGAIVLAGGTPNVTITAGSELRLSTSWVAAS